MRLLSLTLNGTYKGLTPQHFDFNELKGETTALIGLNGSGKSQLLELIAEIFGWLERVSRRGFVVHESVMACPFQIQWKIGGYTYQVEQIDPVSIAVKTDNRALINELSQGRAEDNQDTVICHSITPKPEWVESVYDQFTHAIALYRKDIEPLLSHLPRVIGYSSGLNENLQRGFLKNTVQYFYEVDAKYKFQSLINRKITKELSQEEIDKSYNWYLSRYEYIFSKKFIGLGTDRETYTIALKNTPPPHSIYLDYDSMSLLIASLTILEEQELARILSKTSFSSFSKLTIEYDLHSYPYSENDAITINRLLDIANPEQGINDESQLENLSGTISFDFNKLGVKDSLRDWSVTGSLSFFNKLHAIQLLSIQSWDDSLKDKLMKDNFFGHVKKPLKSRSPISIRELKLTNGDGVEVDFDDLSDGESQLVQTLAAIKVFMSESTLFLFDEPETHLNPAWRTHYHRYLSKVLNQAERQEQSHVFLSTHSPFMISSLQREDVLLFERDDNGVTHMKQIDSQTYGASFDVLIKKHFGLQSLISQTVIEEIREQLKKGDAQALEWINEHLGMSPEKAHLVRKLSQ
ncbi:AAA family ATPase [Vibrio alginolyticus]|nr:AAA family ATPase [Vibrio alginolyticus]